jgi:predicted dehydrogenase
MKAVLQDMKSGALSVGDVPPPALQSGGLLVQVTRSVISLGTERSIIALAKKGPIGKAQDRPDLARKVLNRAKQEGLWNTYQVVKNLLASPIPLGYSCAGRVVAVGSEVSELRVGDRVACAGLGFANHAEVNYIPRNLATAIPDGVSDDNAAFVAIASIAMHGLRLAQISLGESVFVLGLGLVGQITVQLAKAAGATVIGFDPDPAKAELARQSGARIVATSARELLTKLREATGGHGADAVLICAAAKSDAPLRLAAQASRLRGRVISVGDVPLKLDRRAFFEKEIEVRVSRSYGPGRYDPGYEVRGHDYPLAYVRWTERRNMASFLELLAQGSIDLSPLITHRFEIARAESAYEVVTGPAGKGALAIVLEYPATTTPTPTPAIHLRNGRPVAAGASVRLGVIGAGQFAKGILLPEFRKHREVEFVGVCTASGLTSRSPAERYGAQFATSDAAEILSDERINTVVIATRHDQHADLVAAAISAGKAVFCEKPLASTVAGLARVVDTLNAATVEPRLLIGFNRRFSPLAIAARDFVSHGAAPKSILYRVNAGPVPPDNWVVDPVSGGGRIIGEVCHFIDFACFLTGSIPSSVFAEQVAAPGERIADRESVSVVATFGDGSVAVIQYVTCGDTSVPKERVEVASAGRTAVLDNYRVLSLHDDNRTKRRRLMNQQKGHAEEVAAFVRTIATGGPLPIDIETQLAVTRATFAIEASLAARMPVAP